MKEKLENLIRAAEEVVGSDTTGENSDPGKYLSKLNDYTGAFERWQQEFPEASFVLAVEPLAEIEKQEIKHLAEQLNLLHHKIMEMSDSVRESIGAQLVDLHKRGKALKTYVDRYPQRITIAGKRKG